MPALKAPRLISAFIGMGLIFSVQLIAQDADMTKSTPTPPTALELTTLRQQLESAPKSGRAEVLKTFVGRLNDQVKTLREDSESAREQLIALVELRILLTPIVALIKNGKVTHERCATARHEVLYMESFGEREAQRGDTGANDALQILGLFCPTTPQ